MESNPIVASAESSASNDPVQGPELKNRIRGNIEGTDSGRIYGWVCDELNPSSKLEVNVYSKKERVGTSVADRFRKDLKEAGIGDGACAFSVLLDERLYNGLTHELTVVENTSGKCIGTVSCQIPVFAVTHVEHTKEGSLKGYIEFARDDTQESYVVELLVDGSICVEATSTREGGAKKHTVNITIPKHLYDDNYHVVSVRVKGVGTRSEPGYFMFPSMSTGWEHIRDSFASMNLSALPKISAYRYRALQSHLRNLNAGSDGVRSLANIQTAHDVLVRGVERRKKYPVLTLPSEAQPLVTVVIPVHNEFEYTYNCIASLILAYNRQSFEVVLVDDKSTDQTVAIQQYIENLNIVQNEENLGFLRTAESGAELAKGRYIVFLNNDTEVTDGWLDALIAPFEKFEKVGMSGSKLIYPNGRLQEAGGLVACNGEPSNVGNGGNPEDPMYNYLRQADYVSGAAMMIEQSVWKAVGGFSKEFVPAYYEDTDLAFKVREAGYKTLVAPSSVVIHYEGMSNGRDLEAGYKRFQNVNAPRFRGKWRHAYRSHGKYGENIQLELDRNKDFRVLMVDCSTPKPDQDAGSYAAVQEMRLLQELGCKISFAPSNMAHLGKYTTALQDEGIECLYAPFYSDVGTVLKERGSEFDLIYITRYGVAEEILQYIKEYSNAKVVLNNADLHFLREIRSAMAGDESGKRGALVTRKRELEVINTVDAVLSYNDTEHSVISSHTFESEKIFKCPWVLTPKQLKVPFSERHGIAFLGGYNHLPNREAVLYFANEVMPILRKESPGIVFHVYGSSVPEEIEALAADDIIIEGYVESLDCLFDRHRVFIAPLLSGAGIKGKVLESISYQVPCVLSPVAAESTGLVNDLNARIADTPEEWVTAIHALYHDESEWCRLSQKANELVAERYSFDHGLTLMKKMMSFLGLDPAEHRPALYRKHVVTAEPEALVSPAQPKLQEVVGGVDAGGSGETQAIRKEEGLVPVMDADQALVAEVLRERLDWTKVDYQFVEDCLRNTEILIKETDDTSRQLFFAMVALGRFTAGSPAVDDFSKLYERHGLLECAERVRTSSYHEEDLAFYWSSAEALSSFYEHSPETPIKTYHSSDRDRTVCKEIMSNIWEHEPFHEIDKVPKLLNPRSWNLYHLEDVTVIYDTAEFAVLDSSGRPVFDLCSTGYQHVYFTKLFENCIKAVTGAGKESDMPTLDSALMVQDLIREPNYCHWLLDQLPRTRHLQDDQKIIMYKLAPFMKSMLESMGIDSSRVFELQERAVFRVKKLTIESSATRHFFHPCQDLNTELLEYIRSTFQVDSEKMSDEFKPPYVYLSRNKYNRRRISNEQDMLACLEKFGFKTIYPEELSLEEQISVFSHASIIVSPHGAGLANLVFSNDVKVIEIFNQNYGTPTFYLMASFLGFQYQHLLGRNTLLSSDEKQRVGGAQLQKDDIEVDVDRLNHCLETIFKENSVSQAQHAA